MKKNKEFNITAEMIEDCLEECFEKITVNKNKSCKNN
jgi:hypothetical protein